VLELAERVSTLSPIEDGVVFFTSGGSDAIDSAAKLVRRYWQPLGEPERRLIVVREGAYHGVNAFGTSLAGIAANADGYGALVPGVVRVPRDDASAFEQLAREQGRYVAAFFGEPVVGAGGIYPPVDGYWEAIQRICASAGALLVVDKVITGFGRLGRWFGSERYKIQPDIVVSAKGITSGYVPLGALVFHPRVAQPFWEGEAGMFRQGYTYSGHATACAVALANLDILEERLVERVAELEPLLRQHLECLAAHALVEEVRCVGLLSGIELARSALRQQPALSDRVVMAIRDRGVLVRALAGHSIQISPSFVIGETELETLSGALADASDEVAVEMGAATLQ
jgi:putrescine aminotransferase